MKVYVIKYKEWEEDDFGLFGPDRVYREGYLKDVYATKELAEKYKPEDEEVRWMHGVTYSVEEKEVIEQ